MNEALTITTLQILHASSSVGIRVDDLTLQLRARNWRSLTQPELETGLREFADKGWAISHQSSLGPLRWRITSLGSSVLQEHGLI